MRICLLFILFSGFCTAQKSYSDVESIVNARLDNFPKDSVSTKQVKNILKAFNNAGTPKKEDYTLRHVGIVYQLEKANTLPIVNPAIFVHQDSKIGIFGYRAKKGQPRHPDLDIYVNTCMYEPMKLGNTTIFDQFLVAKLNAEGDYSVGIKELVVEEDTALSFVRSNASWLFIVSIDKTYYLRNNPDILIYAFRKDFKDETIYTIETAIEKEIPPIKPETKATVIKSEVTSTEFLYHRETFDNVREPIKVLVTQNPYNFDEKLSNHVAQLTEKLTHDTIERHLDDLSYILYHMSFVKQMEPNYDLGDVNKFDFYNFNHLLAHSLGDYYMAKKEYVKAFPYLLILDKAFFYHSNIKADINEDTQKINLDLSKIYLKGMEQPYPFLAHLWAIIIDGQTSSSSKAKETLLNYAKTYKSKELKEVVDTALLNLEIYPDAMTLNFPYFSKTFKSFTEKQLTKNQVTQRIQKTQFYKELGAL
jgi:hypothetical protein